MRKFLRSALVVGLFFATTTIAKPRVIPPRRKMLPFGVFPHVNTVSPREHRVESLGKEVQNLSQRVESTVRNLAAHRTTSILGDPYLFQAFPLIYTIPDSGFFGGLRAKLVNVAREKPILYSFDVSVVRSDNGQWLANFESDFPKIESLPLDPRLKLRTFYSRTLETRYFGSGPTFIEKFQDQSTDFRYSLEGRGVQSSFILPIFKIGNQQINYFLTFSSINHEAAPFGERDNSKLFIDRPSGANGGVSSRGGMGFLIDSRDRDTMSRSGWALEISGEIAGPPLGQFEFKRISLIDRRYFSKGIFTLGNRITVDSIIGNPPFWELTSVGGIDPVVDISNSTVLRGFPNGRYHEVLKIINNTELQLHLSSRRIFGLLSNIVLIPVGIDLARLGDFNAASLSTGARILFNNALQVQVFGATSASGQFLQLDFGQNF